MSEETHIPEDQKVIIPKEEEAVESTWEELTDGKGDENE